MYGGSLYDLAAEEGLETRILEELDAVADILKQDPEYLHLLSIPSIPKKERCALLDEAFRGKVHLYVLNFVKILCEKGTLRELPGCARALPRALQSGARHPRSNCGHGRAHVGRPDRPPAREAGGCHRQNDRPQDQSGCQPFWAASGWTSRAPSWTARSKTGLASLRRRYCRHYRLIRPKILNKRIEW